MGIGSVNAQPTVAGKDPGVPRRAPWEQFHNLGTLSTSIALEAAELAEFTQWAKDAKITGIAQERHDEIRHEIADIAILVSYLAHELGIDVDKAAAE